VSGEHDLEDLLREIEAITRYDVGVNLAAFIHLPGELLGELTLTGAQTDKLTTVRDAGYRILNTINMAVDLYRMEHGLYRQTPDRCLDLALVLRVSAQELLPLCHSRNISLELRLDEAALPDEAMLTGPGDPRLASALVTNLLRDALLGAPRKSTVTARLTNDDIDQCLRLTIARSGDLPGPMREAFFKKPTPGRDHDGSAKARYAARLLARSLGGTVNVHSGQGRGTTLSLRLPRDGA
jgi:signal transduction histidine kinase